MSSRTPGIIGLVIATAIWGSTFLVTKDTLDTLSVANFLFWRFGVAAVVLLAASPRRWRRLSAGELRKGLLLGLFLGGGFLAQTQGLLDTSAAVSGFVTGLMVVLTPLVAALLYRERVTARGWVAVAVATTGLAFISLRGWGMSPGVPLTILGATLFALQIASLSHWATKDNSYGLTTVSVTVTAGMCLIAALLTGGVRVPSNGPDWTAILYLALGATCMGLVMQAWSQSHLSATTAAVIMTLEPAWAGAIAVVIGGEVLTVRMWIGAALILVAMFIAELGPRGKRDSEIQWVEPV